MKRVNLNISKHCFTIIFSAIGYIPSNYVKEKEFLGLQKYE